MKKKLLILFNLIIIISACEKKTPKLRIAEKPTFEPTNFQSSNVKSENKKDSIKQLFVNNKNEHHSPVKILSATLLPNQYSDHKDIRIVYKNVTKKNIKAIKLEWYCENSFNEPAHGKFFYVQGRSKENVTGLLRSGATQSKIWEDFSTDANKIIKTRVYYVVFTDDSVWELR